MRDQLFLLYELQEIDSVTQVSEDRLLEIPIKANELKAELEHIQHQLQLLKGQHDTIERERRKMEGDLAAEREKLKKWEIRLNDIRNSREFAALSREIEALKRQTRDYEEKILTLMQSGEERRGEIDKVKAQVDELAKVHGVEDAKAREAATLVQQEVAAGKQTREAVTGKVKKNLLRQYEYIRTKKHGMALAIVRDGHCEGCHMQLPPQLYNELQRGDTIEVCPTCQRILFWEQLADSTEPEQPSVTV